MPALCVTVRIVARVRPYFIEHHAEDHYVWQKEEPHHQSNDRRERAVDSTHVGIADVQCVEVCYEQHADRREHTPREHVPDRQLFDPQLAWFEEIG